MSDDALRATMKELDAYLELRSEHRANIGKAQEDLEAAQEALVKLEGEIFRLRAELLGHLHDYALGPIPLPAVTPEQVAVADPVAFIGDPPPKKMGRPKGSLDKRPRKAGSGGYRGRAPRPVREIASADGPKVSPALNSKPALQALETIKASGPEGVPADKLKPWVLGLLARAHYAKKLPNGNWVAA